MTAAAEAHVTVAMVCILFALAVTLLYWAAGLPKDNDEGGIEY